MILVLFLALHGAGQRDSLETGWVLTTGYHYQKHSIVELGVGRALYGIAGHHPVFLTVDLSSELFLDDDLLIGPKISVRSSGGMSMGLNLISYTNFEETEIVFRPDIGIGLGPFAIAYGYNLKFNKTDLPTGRHTISFVFYLAKKLFRAYD